MTAPREHDGCGISGSHWSQPTGLDRRHIEAAGGYSEYRQLLMGSLDATENIATGGAVLARGEFGPWVSRFRMREGALL